MSTFAQASFGKASLLSPQPVPSEPAGASPSLSSHSAGFNGNWSVPSLSPSPSQSAISSQPVFSFASRTLSPSSSLSRVVPAGLVAGVDGALVTVAVASSVA